MQSCQDKEYGTEFYRTGSRINVTDASMSRVDSHYAGLPGMDIVFHDNLAFVISIGGSTNISKSFSVAEPFSARGGLDKGRRSVCVFDYLQ
jgi:hypothetical protein